MAALANVNGMDLVLGLVGTAADQRPAPAGSGVANAPAALSPGPQGVQPGRFNYTIRVAGSVANPQAGRSFQLRCVPSGTVLHSVPAAGGDFSFTVPLTDGLPLHSATQRIRFGVNTVTGAGAAATETFGDQPFTITAIEIQRVGTRPGVAPPW